MGCGVLIPLDGEMLLVQCLYEWSACYNTKAAFSLEAQLGPSRTQIFVVAKK